MIDLNKYRIIDLTEEVLPGELKTDGRYLHGEPAGGRPVELQEFTAFGARMHFIQGQTHTGTHVEAPYKYSDTGTDLGSMPVECYIGEAAACNFEDMEAGAAITPDHFRSAGVKAEDIVLVWGNPADADNPPYMTFEAIDWLISMRVKLFGNENIAFAPPGTPFGTGFGDARLLLGGIVLADGLVGMSQIKRPRVFFIGLPVKMRRLTACCARTIVLEEIDAE